MCSVCMRVCVCVPARVAFNCAGNYECDRCGFDFNSGLDFEHLCVFTTRERARVFAVLFPRGIPRFLESSGSRNRQSLSRNYLVLAATI